MFDFLKTLFIDLFIPFGIVFLIFGCFFVFVFYFLIKNTTSETKHRKTRTKEIAALATSFGYEYSSTGTGELSTKYGLSNYTLLKRFTPKLAQNIVGINDLTLFEYYYHRTASRPSARLCKNVVIFPAPEVPDFVLQPKGGISNTLMDTHSDSSSSYSLEGLDLEKFKSIVGKDAISFLNNNPGLCIEARNGWAATLFNGRKDPEQYLDLPDRARRVWANIL